MASADTGPETELQDLEPIDIDVLDETDIDINEYEDGDDIVRKSYNELNTINEEGDDTPTKPSVKPDRYKVLVKDFVHTRIFLESGMLEELGRMYNCQINFRHKNGRYALFVRPNDTNYMINAFNGLGGEGETLNDRIFFNISLKQEGREPIRTEYMSEYIFKDGVIKHEFKVEGKPATIKKNRVDLSKREPLFNPYFILNELIRNFLPDKKYIGMDSDLGILLEKITSLEEVFLKKQGAEIDRKALIKVKKTFISIEEKAKIDKILNKNYLILKKFLKDTIRGIPIEGIDFKISNKLLYTTNNRFTDMLAVRYATYLPEFKFTKSCVNENKKSYVFSDPFPYKLETPFTATDIYLHRFDRHFNDEYAMDRYNINEPATLMRLARIVELTKSIMMNFINISYQIWSSSFVTPKQISIKIHSIYQGLSWFRESEHLWEGYFNINKKFNKGSLTAIFITKIDSATNNIEIINAIEVPYVGIIPFALGKCKEPYHNRNIIESRNTFDRIDLQGVERFMIENRGFDDRNMDRIYQNFFDSAREKPLQIKEEQGDYIELSKEEFSISFPELNALPKQDSSDTIGIQNIPGVVDITYVKSPSSTVWGLPATSAATVAPAATVATTSTPIETGATLVKKGLPFGTEISKLVIDIKKFKSDFSKPIKGESRRARGIRMKQIRPLIKKLEDLKAKQIRELKSQGRDTSSAVAGIRQLKIEGVLPTPEPGRRQKARKRIKEQIEQNRQLLLAEADKIRILETEAKSATQLAIVGLMNEILELKRSVLLNPPRGRETDEITREQAPTYAKIAALEEKIAELKDKDLFDQGRIAETRAVLAEKEAERAAAAEAARLADLDRQKQELKERIEKDLEKVQESETKLADMQGIYTALKQLAETKISSTSNEDIKKVYNDALISLTKSLEDYNKYVVIAREFQLVRADPSRKDEGAKMSRQYKDASRLSTKAIEHFNKAKVTIEKSIEEINSFVLTTKSAELEAISAAETAIAEKTEAENKLAAEIAEQERLAKIAKKEAKSIAAANAAAEAERKIEAARLEAERKQLEQEKIEQKAITIALKKERLKQIESDIERVNKELKKLNEDLYVHQASLRTINDRGRINFNIDNLYRKISKDILLELFEAILKEKELTSQDISSERELIAYIKSSESNEENNTKIKSIIEQILKDKVADKQSKSYLKDKQINDFMIEKINLTIILKQINNNIIIKQLQLKEYQALLSKSAAAVSASSSSSPVAISSPVAAASSVAAAASSSLLAQEVDNNTPDGNDNEDEDENGGYVELDDTPENEPPAAPKPTPVKPAGIESWW